MPIPSDVLSIQYKTLFRVAGSGRIERENDPDRSPGPRLWLAGDISGTLAGIRTDVPGDAAADVMALVAEEPPFVLRDGLPHHLDRYVELLRQSEAPSIANFGQTFILPNGLAPHPGLDVVHSESEAGRRLRASLSTNGMPAGLLELGFRHASDFWEPWCAVLYRGDVAAMAFAARISERGAEVGVATVPSMRGRGFAGAAVAAWSRLPSLKSRVLFYSVARTNPSSQRVASKLNLLFVGPSLRLS